MSEDRDTAGTRAMAAVAAVAAAWIARRVITFGWTKITGKEPPGNPEDPHVGVGEALTWAVILGVAIETARVLATRAATKQAATRKMRQAPPNEVAQ